MTRLECYTDDILATLTLNPLLEAALNEATEPNYCQRARAHIDNDDCEAAMRDINSAWKQHPGLAEAYLLRGRVRGMKGQYVLALRDFNQAISQHENEARYFRALTLLVLCLYEQALSDLNLLLRRDPKEHSARMIRAALHEECSRAALALRDYKGVAAFMKTHPEAYSLRGWLYERRRAWRKALWCFLRAGEEGRQEGRYRRLTPEQPFWSGL